jgi:anti-anti-sigma factor
VALVRGEVTVVHFAEPRVNLDEETGRAVTKELLRLGEGMTGGTLIFDLGSVEYLTSTMLGGLLKVHKQLQLAGSQFILQNVRPRIYDIFQITRLTGILSVRPAESPELAAGGSASSSGGASPQPTG